MTKNKIREIYREFNVPKHIIAHMQSVARIAAFLANQFKVNGFKIDEKNLIYAALLHDVLRYVDFPSIEPEKFPEIENFRILNKRKKIWQKYHHLGHEKAMGKIMKERGEMKISNLISKHGFFSIYELKSWEEKILYYSDKRVDRDKIVSLERRFSEGKKRNMTENDNLEMIHRTENSIRNLEKDFTKILGKKTMAKIKSL